MDFGITLLTYIFAILAAISYGWIEQHLFSQGAQSGNRKLFGKFAFPYHFPAMFMVLFAAAWPVWQLIFILPLIQDLSYFYFANREIETDSWVSSLAGYFNWNGNIIPYAYILSIAIFIIILIIF